MKKRSLSIPRVIIAILTLIGISYYSFRLLNNVNEISKTTPYRPWFGPYVDVTATPKYNFEQLENLNIQNNYVLAFIVSSNSDPCLPTWGNAYTLDEASDELDLDRGIERYRQLGGNIAISFGGLLNNELAVNCKDNQKLKSSYMSIIDRYKIDTLDFDIENDALKDADSVKRRSVVLAQLQKEMRSNNKNLAIWLTLPVSPQGLTTEGTEAIKTMLSNGIDLTGVNIMTMDYGESKDKNLSMAQASREAVLETRRQLEILYKQVNINLTDKSLWAKIGVTPMIGQNDIQDEILTLQDASDINQFAKENGIGRIS